MVLTMTVLNSHAINSVPFYMFKYGKLSKSQIHSGLKL